MFSNTRSKLVLVLVAALAASALVFAAGAGAQRTGASRQANQNSGGRQTKRVIVGRGSETKQGSRVTITADDSLKDYRSYRSGDRLYVELPKSAAPSGLRGSGKGYSDMKVEQRGDSVIVSYRVQPGAKSRVEQRFNRLEVVFDVPEGGGGQQPQQPATTGDAARTQPQPAETRNQTTAAQQSSQAAATPPASNPNNAAERAAAAAEAARAQQAANAANAATTPSVVTAEPPTSAAVDPNAQPGATPASGLTPEGTPAATPPTEAQLAQAQPPAATAPISITKPATGEPTGTTLGAFLLRNWALTLIISLVIVGLGLVIAARRTTAATPEPVERADAAAPVEPRAARAKEASAAALREASATAQTSTLKASTLKAATPEAVTLKTSTPDVAEASTLDAAETSIETPTAEVMPLVGGAALAGGAAVAKSRKQSRKEARQEARKKKKGARSDTPADAETVDAAAAVQGPSVEEPSVEEPFVEAAGESAVEVFAESAVEETAVAETFVETPAVEESRVEEFAAAPPEVEETALEGLTAEEAAAEETSIVFADLSSAEEAEDVALLEQTSEAPAFEETVTEEVVETSAAPAVEEAETSFVETSEVAAAETSFDTAEAPTVETEIAPTALGIAPVVAEAVAHEAAEAEEVEQEAVEAEAPSSVTEIEPAFAPEPERVQAETRSLLEGGAYDRTVIGTRDPLARQVIAAELLSALAGRNPQRRERAGAAFVEEGYYDETARDLRAADAPAERAAAARSLALLGDRAATPLLVEALEDPSLDVRRAAVEALGALRDPAAVAPLEALLERERNERNRIPPRVIRVAADSCRDAAAELDAELASAGVSATADEVGHAATSVEIEPVAEAALETETAYAETESAQPAEVAAHETAEESSVSVAPYVEEQEYVEERPYQPAEDVAEVLSHTAEPSLFDDERADEEVTLVAQAPAAVDEVDPFVAELSDVLADTSESQSFETAVSEPEAVAETGIEPLVETEEEAEAVSEPVAAAPAEEVALEPFRESDAEEFTTHTYAPAAESEQATLFDEGAAEEDTRELAPFQSGSTDESVAAGGAAGAGEWFDFDMQELREEPQPAETETAAAPSYEQEEVFESSSGETFTSYAETGTAETYAAEEPPPFAHAGDEVTREVEAYGAGEYEDEEVAPAATRESGLVPFDEFSTVPASIQHRLSSRNAAERAAAIVELSKVDTDEAFQQICAGFDDPSRDVRSAAARALYGLRADRAESFTRALREATPERRRGIGMAISASGLAGESISQLTGESREKTYEAFSLLFLMAKAGEVQPLVRAIEGHPSSEVRLAVVKLLALSGQKEILPAFRRLAVRGSLPTEVRSAVMEAIYQISSSQPTTA
ncbi:MAG TPA: HEAT repeat domain-containing protein [Pyrinomonadaceae bacterium]